MNDRPDLQKAVYHLNNESNRLARLVDEVLTLSRFDADKENFVFEKLKFSDLILDTMGKLQLRAEKYGIQMVSNIEPDIDFVGDKEKLVQVIVNLLDNAFKYSPSKSSVTVLLFRESNMAFLSISDQGVGIPQEDTTKVFERFYRAENARGISGTGLGLSIVKQIVDAHKGTIELVTGVSGKGTTAKLKLPIT